MRRAVFVSLAALSIACPLRAQQQPLLQRSGGGGGLDSINTLNGNLTVSIPIGQFFPLRTGFGYQLRAVYNSNLWHAIPDLTELGQPIIRTSTANGGSGLGWSFTLGNLIKPGESAADGWINKWIYVSSSGSRHVFYDRLHSDDPPTSGPYVFTRDGSYLRLRTDLKRLDFPDGTSHYLDHYGLFGWSVRRIEDPFGNYVNVTENATTKAWTISDSAGRSHTVDFVVTPGQRPRVSRVTLEGAAGSHPTWNFAYASASLREPCFDTDDRFSDTITDYLLVSITGPEGLRYEFKTSGGAPGYETGIGATCQSDETHAFSGALTRMVLPEKGEVQWTWRTWRLPLQVISPLTEVTYGVGTRYIRDPYSNQGAMWTYTPEPFYPSGWQNEPLGNFIAFENRVTVRDPNGYDWVHYYSVPAKRLEGASSTWARAWDYGLNRSTGVTWDTYYGLARELKKDGVRLRSWWVEYDKDKLAQDPNDGKDRNLHINSNRRILNSRVRYDDDGSDRYVQVKATRATYDGLGHYREFETYGRFGNQAADQVTRLDLTEFNPANGNYVPGGTGFTPIGTSAPWILSTYSRQRSTENGVAEKRFDFNGQTGFLNSIRALANGSNLGSGDGRIVFDCTGGSGACSGDPKEVRYYSGDALTPDYTVKNTYVGGVLATSKYVQPGNEGNVVLWIADRTIDASTGLPSSVRDAAGLATNLSYDGLGRVEKVEPLGPGAIRLAQTSFTRTFAAGSTDFSKVVLKASCPSTASCTTVLLESETRYDGFGRQVEERLHRPGGWSERMTSYNRVGWPTKIGEWSAVGSSAGATIIQYAASGTNTIDPWGRPRVIVHPDTTSGQPHRIDISYSGVRVVSRNRRVATAIDSQETSHWMTESFDPLGRLLKVTDGPLVAEYDYHVTNQLSRATVKPSGGGTTQVYEFDYNGRGLLTRSLSPSKGGATLFTDYDALGRLLKLRDGQNLFANEVGFNYDKAGRLIRVYEGGVLTARLTYDEPSVGSYSGGKLTTAESWNYFAGAGVDAIDVTERYLYGGRGGAPSSRTTTLARHKDGVETPLGSVTQTFDWTWEGSLSGLGYPDWDSTASEPSQNVSYSYNWGFLASVAEFAPSLTYHPNLALASVQHANGVVDNFSQDPNQMQRTNRIYTTGVAGGLELDTGTYRYDSSGNVKSIGANRFAYDEVSRLKEARVWVPDDEEPPATAFDDGFELGSACRWGVRNPDPGCPPYIERQGVQTFAYNAFGGLTQETTDATQRSIPTDAATNRLNATGTTYDVRGNIRVWNGVNYEFDLQNRMRRMTNGPEDWIFAYTAGGQRIAAISEAGAGAARWTFRGLGGKVLREYTQADPAATPVWQVDWIYRGALPLATVSATSPGQTGDPDGLMVDELQNEASNSVIVPRPIDPVISHLTLDHLGTPRLVTDENGERLSYHAYWPFGQEASDANQDDLRHKFTGHERDFFDVTSTNDDLDYMVARFFNPLPARFLSLDPVSPNPRALQSWNGYSYVGNNPLTFLDPLGLCGVEDPEDPCTDETTVTADDPGDGNIWVWYPPQYYWLDQDDRFNQAHFFQIEWRAAPYSSFDGAMFSEADWMATNPAFSGEIRPASGPLDFIAFGVAGALRNAAARSGTTLLAQTSIIEKASRAAQKAASQADRFVLGRKHRFGEMGGWNKFAEGVNPNSALREALSSPGARFLPNDAGSFKVVADLGRAIGARGETGVRAVVDFDGNVVTWFPVHP